MKRNILWLGFIISSILVSPVEAKAQRELEDWQASGQGKAADLLAQEGERGLRE